MHPVIRIVSLVVFCAALAASALYGVVCAALGLLPIAWGQWRSLWPVLRRMRWLLLSILILYAGFTPGDPWVAAAPYWMPSVQGVEEGVARVLALVVLVVAVQWMLRVTDRGPLVAALVWLTAPLRYLGWPQERFAVRVMLVFDAVRETQTLYQEFYKAPERDIGARAAHLFEAAVARANAAPLQTLQVQALAAPPWYQWFYPLGIAVVFGLLNILERMHA